MMRKYIVVLALSLVGFGLTGCLFLYNIGGPTSELTLSEARELINNDMREACSSLAEDDILLRLLGWYPGADGALDKHDLLIERISVCETAEADNTDETEKGPFCDVNSTGYTECLSECTLCNAMIIEAVYPATDREDVTDVCYYMTKTDIETLIALYRADATAGVSIEEAIVEATESCNEEPGDTGEVSICTACRISIIEYVRE